MAGVRPDPLAPLVGLPGVEDAVRRAREAVVALHRHPVNRTGWAASAAEAALRAARASAALDGAELARADGVVSDPVLAGSPGFAPWQGCPSGNSSSMFVTDASPTRARRRLGFGWPACGTPSARPRPTAVRSSPSRRPSRSRSPDDPRHRLE